MVNLEFLIITYLIGLSVDWILQWDWQAVNKSKWDKNDNKLLSGVSLVTHSLTYAVITGLLVSIIINLDINQYAIAMIVLFISHIIIDSRIPVKAIMKFKLMTDEQINDYTNYGFMHIGIDHRLHELVILILSMFI